LPLDRAAPGDAASDLADRDQLERGFKRLPVEQRAVLVMHHYLGLRLTEIAETLGVPEGTVRSRLHYATLAMRAVLEADARPVLVAEGGRTA
jgi:RNA polymerase sigma-70 factor (ECF subfamily)